MNKNKIIFCGLDEKLFQHLVEDNNFYVVAVNLIHDLVIFKSLNPVDLLFKTVYKNIIKNYTVINIFLIFLLKSFLRFGSKLTQKYYLYLQLLFKYKIRVFDFNNLRATVDFVTKNNIELLIVSNWWILPDTIIFAPKYGAINIHPSKLPEYRGSVPTLWSLKNKDRETAVTLMKLNSKIDNGEIISQHIIPIYSDDNAIRLEQRCDAAIKEFIIDDVKKYLSHELQLAPQDNNLASFTAKYYEYQEINWLTETQEEIINKIKLYPYLWPIDCCFYFYKNKKIKIHDAAICHTIPEKIIEISALSPGTKKILDKFMYVKTINGVIMLKLFRDLCWLDSVYFKYVRQLQN